jgi:hypothetical protein
MLAKLFLYAVIFVISWSVSHLYKITYTFSDFKEFATVLLNASAMVFTLMGIWIAFLYPNALSRIIDPKTIEVADFSEASLETKRLEAIVGSVLKSALIVLCVMAIFLGKVIFSATPIYIANVNLVKEFALSLIIVSSYIQAEAIWHVVYANLMFINDLHRRKDDRVGDADI